MSRTTKNFGFGKGSQGLKKPQSAASSSSGLKKPPLPPVPVAMIWDAESMPTQPSRDGTLVSKINESLQKLDPRFFLQSIYISANDEEGFAERRLQIKTGQCDVYYFRAPMMSLRCQASNCEWTRESEEEPFHDLKRVKEIADRILMEKMLKHAHYTRRDHVMLVVANDKDFRHVARDLAKDGYTVLAAVVEKQGKNYSPLAQVSCAFWYWIQMQQGGDVEKINDPSRFPPS